VVSADIIKLEVSLEILLNDFISGNKNHPKWPNFFEYQRFLGSERPSISYGNEDSFTKMRKELQEIIILI
jgi:hypothetical protein